MCVSATLEGLREKGLATECQEGAAEHQRLQEAAGQMRDELDTVRSHAHWCDQVPYAHFTVSHRTLSPL